MSSTTKRDRLNFPIAVLKQVLLEHFKDDRVKEAVSTARIEEYALEHANRKTLAELVAQHKKKLDSMKKDQENTAGAAQREINAQNSGACHYRPQTSAAKISADPRGASDDELQAAYVQDSGRQAGPRRFSQISGLVSQLTTREPLDHHDGSLNMLEMSSAFPTQKSSSSQQADPCYSYCYAGGPDSYAGRSRASFETVSRIPDTLQEPNNRRYSNSQAGPFPQRSSSARSPGRLSGQPHLSNSSGQHHLLSDWGELTPANDSLPSETPLLRAGISINPPTTTHFAPSHYYSQTTQRSGPRSSCGSGGYTKVMQTSYKSSVPRIIESSHEGLIDQTSTSRYMTPASGRSGYPPSQVFRGAKSRRDYINVAPTPLTRHRMSCRPCDEVPYNPNPMPPSPICERSGERPHEGRFDCGGLKTCASLAWRCKYAIILISVALWFFGIPNPRSLSSLGGFTSLLPSQKSTGTLPTFCSMRRGDSRDCTPCPRRALCYEGRAECPTYYALEKISPKEWDCQSYKEELERIAQEGFSRVVSYLRKIEKPVGCGAEIMSHVESRRDVLYLFDHILMPMLDERQKGLKDGLLQMYLTLLSDNDRLRELNLEKEGSLHVTLASIVSKTRLACHLPSGGHFMMSAVFLGCLGAAYLNYKMR